MRGRASGGCLSPLHQARTLLSSLRPRRRSGERLSVMASGGSEAAARRVAELEEELRSSRAAARLIKNLCDVFGIISRCQNQILLKLSA